MHPTTTEPDTPEVPTGQPTWARVRHGAGCGLPRRMKDGSIGVLPIAVPILLQRTRLCDDEGRAIWLVPGGEWSPGDTVEIGPLPADVIVKYEIRRPFVTPLPARVNAEAVAS